jgi:hypothetical protein
MVTSSDRQRLSTPFSLQNSCARVPWSIHFWTAFIEFSKELSTRCEKRLANQSAGFLANGLGNVSRVAEAMVKDGFEDMKVVAAAVNTPLHAHSQFSFHIFDLRHTV